MRPGPGAHDLSATELGKNVKGSGVSKSFGIGRKAIKERYMTPGPGQYSLSHAQSQRVITGTRPAQVKMGTMKRSGQWGAEKKASEGLPGPGQHLNSHSSFQNQKGGAASFGTGRRLVVKGENTPGPGQYDQTDHKRVTSQNARQVKIGSAPRQDVWSRERGAGKAGGPSPGPGDYLNQSHTFGQAVKGGYMA